MADLQIYASGAVPGVLGPAASARPVAPAVGDGRPGASPGKAAADLPAQVLAAGNRAGAAVSGKAPNTAPSTMVSPTNPANLPSDTQVKAAVKHANAALAEKSTQLVFVFDDQTHHFAVKLLDIQTQKVVQQIPPAAMPATVEALTGAAGSGALVDTKV